jgi:cell wall-associated NlpC family hydrolase
MQLSSRTLGLFSAILFSGGVSVDIQGEPIEPKPKIRAFRAIVPIKQNVRGGVEQMKSQTMTVKIPPPPIPEHPPVVDLSTPLPAPTVPEPVLTDGPAPEFVGPLPENAETNLPPEPLKEAKPAITEEKKEQTVEADSPPEPAPAAENKEKKKPVDGPTLERLHAEAHALAEKKLTYIFGAENPDSGGLDCSATIQYLLNKIGVKDVPRTSYDQYAWLKKNKMLDDVYGKSAHDKLFKKLSPGDLIFWGGTYNSGHRVSHVMLYMGYDKATDKHYIFGARGKSVKGLTGCGVDIFELSQQKGRLIAHGKIPGLIY